MFSFNFYQKVFIILCILSVQLVMAAAEKDDGKSIETVKETSEFSGKQDNQWMQLQTELQTAKTKLDAQQVIVTELLTNKKNTTGKISQSQVEQLNSHHQKLQELINEYNKKLSDFEVRYPEKGQALGRQYSRKKQQSIDQMENSLTLDGRIRKINNKIKSQFGVKEGGSATVKKVPQSRAENKKKRIDLQPPVDDVTEKIIIVK